MTQTNDFNQQMIEQFRANGGRLDFGPASLLLLTTTGAKTGRKHTTPLAVFDDDGRIYVIAVQGRRALASGVVPQPRRQPDRHRRAQR